MYWPARYWSRSFAGQLEPDDRDVRRRLVDRLDAARQLADPDVAGAAHFAHLDHEIGLGLRAAEEREPRLLLVVGQRRRLVRAVVDAAFEDLPLARAARAVAAAVRQHQVGVHRRGEHGVALGARERMIARLYGNLVRHRQVDRKDLPRGAGAAETKGAVRDPGIVDWLRRRRAAHRRPAPSESPTLRAHATRRRTFPGCARTASCPSSATSTGARRSSGFARRRSRCCISRRRLPKVATIRGRRS